MIFLSGCLGPNEENQEQNSQDGEISLTLWHTFCRRKQGRRGVHEFNQVVRIAHPNVTVDVTMVPFGSADQLFMTAAQGGQAPDLMRLSSDQLGAIGEARRRLSLLEDLRPHLTPQDRAQFEDRALQAMRYGDALYGVPASQDCLS